MPRLPDQLDQGLLDDIVRAVAQLPGVKFQRRGVPIEQASEKLGPNGAARVGIVPAHHRRDAGRRIVVPRDLHRIAE